MPTRITVRLLDKVVAWGAFAVTVPSALWRVAMILGWLPGTDGLRAEHAGDEAYVFGLSTVQLGAGALTVGLVRPWGERIGRVDVPRWFPVVVGGAGGAVVTWLFTVQMPWQLLHGARPDQGEVHGGALALMVGCYAPILLWGPLELAAVAAYARRRTGQDSIRTTFAQAGGSGRGGPSPRTATTTRTPRGARSGHGV